MSVGAKILVVVSVVAIAFAYQNCSAGFTTQDTQEAGLAATAGGSAGGSIALAWDANTEPNLAGYRVHYGTSPGNYDQVIDAGSPTPVNGTVRFSVPGLVAGQMYYFAVTAYETGIVESPLSNEISRPAP